MLEGGVLGAGYFGFRLGVTDGEGSFLFSFRRTGLGPPISSPAKKKNHCFAYVLMGVFFFPFFKFVYSGLFDKV